MPGNGGGRGGLEILLLSDDLLARSRVLAAAAAAGVEVHAGSPRDALEELRRHPGAVALLDLDGGRGALLEDLQAARAEGVGPVRALGFLSHVDAALGDAARRAGCEALPRGRFWRELPELLTEAGPAEPG